MMRSVLCLGYLFLSTAFTQDFRTRCNQLTDGANVKSLYYRGTCYVADKTTGKKYADLQCKQLERPGYLAILPGTILLQKMLDYFGATYVTNSWIGLMRNQTTSASSPASSREFWYWHDGTALRWKAEPDLTVWHSSEPNDAGQTCGYIHQPVATLTNYPCTYTAFGYLCQYSDYRKYFKLFSRGGRARVLETLEEHTVQHQLACATKCHILLPCQSYTFSQSSSLCVLQMLPAAETTTVALDDAQMYDLIE